VSARAWRTDLEQQGLEVAVGAGGNLEYYNRDRVRSLTIADVSWWMLEVATARAHEELGSIPLKVVQADCSAMASIEDGTFDTVLDTYGVCSFEDPVRALSEMARVCRPDGRVLLLEHGMASLGPLRALQSFFSEPWAWRHGCRCDFDILALRSSIMLSWMPLPFELHSGRQRSTRIPSMAWWTSTSTARTGTSR